MTREEAIYRLKNMAWLYGSAEREQNIEAIDMAIEALKDISKTEEIAIEQILNEAKRSEKHSYDIYTYYRDRIRNVCTNSKEYKTAVKSLINILEV